MKITSVNVHLNQKQKYHIEGDKPENKAQQKYYFSFRLLTIKQFAFPSTPKLKRIGTLLGS